MTHVQLHIPNTPDYITIIEELSICKTQADFINYAFFCFDRAETTRNGVSDAYFKTACKIYKLHTNKFYTAWT